MAILTFILLWVVSAATGMWTGKDVYLNPVCHAEDLVLPLTTTETTVIHSTVTSYTFGRTVIPTLTLTETLLATPHTIRWVEVTVNPQPLHVTYTSFVTFTTYMVRRDAPHTTITHTSVDSAVLSVIFTRQDVENMIITTTAVVNLTTIMQMIQPPTTVTLTSTVTREGSSLRSRYYRSLLSSRVVLRVARTRVPHECLPTLTPFTCSYGNSTLV